MKFQFSVLLQFISLAFVVFASDVNASERVAKSYDINDVTEVVINGGTRLEIVQGENELLRVEANKDVIDRVVVDLSDHKLTLSVRGESGKGFNFFRWFDNNNGEAIFKLQLKQLQFLGLSGASHANLGNWIDKNLVVKASGAAEVRFADLTLKDFYLELTGASNARAQQMKSVGMKYELSGAANMDVKAVSQTTFLNVGASGASNFKGKLLRAEQADVGASGASTIELNAISMLKASASGASNVRYLGQPKLQSNSSGASHITATND